MPWVLRMVSKTVGVLLKTFAVELLSLNIVSRGNLPNKSLDFEFDENVDILLEVS